MKIYKYTISPWVTQYKLPKGSTIISAISQKRDGQDDDIIFYALVNPDETESEIHEIRVYGTGHQIHPGFILDVNFRFINTVTINNGTLVFHIFEVLKEA